MRLHASLIAAGLAALSLGAAAQTVALQGMLGSKALLMVGGSAPRAVAPGETLQGVTLALGLRWLERWGAVPAPRTADGERINHAALDLRPYEDGRPDASVACRLGDARFLNLEQD